MLDYQAPRCIGEENLRFEMRPGLTGLAQVKGRNNILWEDRIQYDIEYVKTFSFWLDIKILFKTVLKSKEQMLNLSIVELVGFQNIMFVMMRKNQIRI